jgi:hypothetical protein
MDTGSLQTQLKPLLVTLTRLRVYIFLAIVVLLYAYLGLRINTLRSAQPTTTTTAATNTLALPHIDPAAISKIEHLQANSQGVQTLFNQARGNPFSE